MRKNTIPKVPLEDFTKMTKGLAKDGDFRLVNQDLRNGYIYFTGQNGPKKLQQLIAYYNTGRLPPSTIHTMRISAAKMKSLGFNMKSWIASLGDVKGPDSGGFYQARCPSCAARGGDSTGNHLVYTEEGVVHCYAGCKFIKIIDGFCKKEESS